MLAHPELPPGLIEPALDVLTEIMPTERELIRVVVEIIIELREDDNGDNIDVQSIAVMYIFLLLHACADHATLCDRRMMKASQILLKVPSPKINRCGERDYVKKCQPKSVWKQI
jgi:hypothetical protein